MMKHIKNLTFRNLAFACGLTLLGALAGCSNGPESTSQPQPGKAAVPTSDPAMLAAAAAGDNAKVRELLEKGASANMLGRDHNTPIMEAAYAGHLDTVKLLLDHGADLSVKKSDGATALDLGGRHQDVMDLFKNVSALVAAAGRGDNQAVKQLMDKGTPVNGLDEFGHTALTEASWNGFAETVKLLLDHGANPSITKSDGETPLSLATGKKHQAIVDLLNQANAKRVAATPAAK